MTQNFRPGDRVRVTVLATISPGHPAQPVDSAYVPMTLDGHDGPYAFDRSAAKIEVIERAQLDAAQAVAGDRISDSEDDWGTVIFNDAHGEQLLVAYDQLYGRALVAYDRVRIVRRPADLVQGIYDPPPVGEELTQLADIRRRMAERMEAAAKVAAYEAEQAKGYAVPSDARRFMPRGFA